MELKAVEVTNKPMSKLGMLIILLVDYLTFAFRREQDPCPEMSGAYGLLINACTVAGMCLINPDGTLIEDGDAGASAMFLMITQYDLARECERISVDPSRESSAQIVDLGRRLLTKHHEMLHQVMKTHAELHEVNLAHEKHGPSAAGVDAMTEMEAVALMGALSPDSVKQ